MKSIVQTLTALAWWKCPEKEVWRQICYIGNLNGCYQILPSYELGTMILSKERGVRGQEEGRGVLRNDMVRSNSA